MVLVSLKTIVNQGNRTKYKEQLTTKSSKTKVEINIRKLNNINRKCPVYFFSMRYFLQAVFTSHGNKNVRESGQTFS